jgi:predicted nucleotide-binding protein
LSHILPGLNEGIFIIKLSPERSIKKLQDQVMGIEEIQNFGLDSAEFRAWKRNTEVAIENIFGDETRHLRDFKSIHYVFTMNASNAQQMAEFGKGLRNAKAILQSMIDEIREYHMTSSDAGNNAEKMNEIHAQLTKEIFIVHGKDEEMKLAVCDILKRQDLIPVILDEMPNSGRTIIEKFEAYSNVSFAIILLSPDDYGYNKDDGFKKARPRARQNAILELGFFIGKLRRKRVVVLHRQAKDFEMPSDYSGVLFIPYDSGSWKNRLLRELRDCGYIINANQIL